MTQPLTQQQLDRLVCSTPDCSHKEHEALFLHGRCHPGGRLDVKYQKDDGTLTITCRECATLVAHLLVARTDPTT